MDPVDPGDIALWVLGLTELGGSSMHTQTGGRYIHHCQ